MNTLYAVAEYGKVVLKEKEIPDPGPGQLLLEAEFSSLSPGTEHDLMAGHILPLPQNIGYSMAARVIKVGEGVTDYKVGDQVVTTGQHAQYLLMDAHNVTPAPKGVDMEQAAFFNLAHTGMYAVRRTKIQLGEPVVVMGQGLVGAIAAQLAKLAGALPVIVTDLDDRRLEIAKKMGVHYAINPKTNPNDLKNVIDSLGTNGVPVVIEATGARQPLEEAFEIVSERGRVMMLSQAHGNDAPKYDHNLMMKGATLIGGYINSKPFALRRYDLMIKEQWPPVISDNSSRYVNSDVWTSDEDIRVILNLIKYGSLNLKPLITHRFSVEQISEAYDLVWRKDTSLIGGVICWK
ncbi:zinc-binding alcohol dehydrogenase [Caloramator sp. E03]|uniref:zinc-dependent alcohol dehydrogenase n=1 Tax=Caloramator sp. E03 TaxID=2576307 RepID=UPI001110AA7F|nr:zinc-binding alcohol dehydrogenase [Caloramator sp. E03]QCX34415.1 zinc-binding alcohol dehydrogenase [Caloramator sp. E03]